MFPIIMAVAAIATQVLSSASGAQSQAVQSKMQNQMAANKAKYDSRIAQLNAKTQAFDTVANQIALEQEASQKALQEAAVMAQTRVSHAASGVAMDSASSYEVRANQQLMHVAGMANAEMNRVQALNNDQLKMTQYRANAMLSRAEAQASSIVADSIKPSKVLAQSLLTGGIGGVAQFGSMTGMFGQTGASGFGGLGGLGGLDSLGGLGGLGGLGSLFGGGGGGVETNIGQALGFSGLDIGAGVVIK